MARPSFTRRTNGIGQRIRAEHINELQVAIEEDGARIDELMELIEAAPRNWSIDGGTPYSEYGGMDSIDGGTL